VYLLATFNARASYVGDAFEYACFYLLKEKFGFNPKITGERTRLYDFELKTDVVVEAKGSPDHIINPDGTHTKLGRPGMSRSDTKKKAFANGEEWNKRFPNGSFFIITNSMPSNLTSYRSRTITGIYDVTKKKEIEQFTSELPR
jgi:hypothetical protein